MEPPGKLEWGGGWEEGGKLFESKDGADELEERGQGGDGLLEAKKSEEWPLAIELRHLARVARVSRQIRGFIRKPGRADQPSQPRCPTCMCTHNHFPLTLDNGASNPVKG